MESGKGSETYVVPYDRGFHKPEAKEKSATYAWVGTALDPPAEVDM
jgi:hypothetical protein